MSCTRYIRKPCTLNYSDDDISGQFFYPGLCFKSTVISAKYITIQIRMLTNSDDTNNGNNIQNLPTKTYEFEPVLVMLHSVVTKKIVSKKITCYIREKSASCVVGKVEVNVLISL